MDKRVPDRQCPIKVSCDYKQIESRILRAGAAKVRSFPVNLTASDIAEQYHEWVERIMLDGSSTFQKRHMEPLAGALARVKPVVFTGDPTNNIERAQRDRTVQWKRCVEAIATMLKQDNPKFNAPRFIGACMGAPRKG